jgi:Domain of unknown function (DUF4307)
MVSEPAIPTFTFCVVSFIGEVSRIPASFYALARDRIPHMSAQSRASNPYLRARYGIPEPSHNRYKKWFTPALIALVIGGSWLAWSANHYSRPEIRSTLISFQPIDNSHISIRYSVSFRSAEKAHLCQLIARDLAANTVGEITDHFPAGTTSKTLVSVIPTRVAAVNAAISRCALG